MIRSRGTCERHLKVSLPRPSGMALIMTAGVLAILAALGTALYALTSSQVNSSVRYADMVRSELLAQAGIQEAISRLQLAAFIKTEDPTDNWYMIDWFKNASRRTSFRMGDGKDNEDDYGLAATGDGIVDNEPEPSETYKAYARALTSSVGENSDRYTLEVEDAGGKININACDNLAVVLDNLCRMIGPPLVAADEDLLQPKRWFDESGGVLTTYGANSQDTKDIPDAYYLVDAKARPLQADQAPYAAILGVLGKPVDGRAVYGDGYAIAGYRGRNGPLGSVEELKNALTFVDRNGNGIADDPLERIEIEVKYVALNAVNSHMISVPARVSIHGVYVLLVA